MNNRHWGWTLILFLAVLPVSVHAQFFSAQEFPESTAELIGLESVVPGTSFRVDLILTIPQDWHTYWSNPGDGGAAAIINWKLPEGFIVGEAVWPLPRRYREGENIIYGMEGEATVSFPFSIKHGIPYGSHTIEAVVEWLYCGPVCIPSYATVSSAITIGFGASDSDVSDIVVAEYTGIDAQIIRLEDGYEIRVPTSVLAESPLEDLWFYPDEWGWIDQSSPQIWIRDGNEFVVNIGPGVVESTQISGLLVAHDGEIPMIGFSVDSIVEPIKQKQE